MSGLKSGAIVLLLAVPFVLYGLFQVQTVTRPEVLVSDPPSEKGMPDKDRLAAGRTKTEKWVADGRKAGTVAFQFRRPTADDKAADEDWNSLAAAAAARSDDLTDLEKFLSAVKDPQFFGKMKDRYKGWYDETEALRKAAVAVEGWFDDRFPTIDGPAPADAALKRLNALLDEYTKGNSIFMDRGAIAGWKVRARARIVEALSDAAKKPYDAVLQLSLPLPSEEKSADVRTAVGALREMKSQVKQLEQLAGQAAADGIALPKPALTAKTRALDLDRNWASGVELLTLFADPELFTDPKKPAEWLPKVEAQLNRSQDKDLIRKKVQQFCDAFIPKAAKFDDFVLIGGNPIPRGQVRIEFRNVLGSHPLSDLPDDLSEFNFETFKIDGKPVAFERMRYSTGKANESTGMASLLKPTAKSIAGNQFREARAAVTIWSQPAVETLKKACEAKVAMEIKNRGFKLEERIDLPTLLDGLEGVNPGGTGGPAWTKENTKIWTRLSNLSDAMKAVPDLFPAKP